MPNKFPLVVWESTEECKREAEEARKTFEELTKRLYGREFTCTFFGSMQLDDNGVPEFWLNDSHNIYRNNWTAEEALVHALKHGDTGWWNLEQIAQFVDRKGPIFEEAMWDLGFRRHKKDASKWARLSSDERHKSSPLSQRLWEEKHGKVYTKISEEEAERLKPLLVMPNESEGISKTYDIKVGKRGMIYIALWANPFAGNTAETLCLLSEQLANRGHIAKQQEGFTIEARNIQLASPRDMPADDKRAGYIHIQAKRPNETYAKCVWPSQIPSRRIYELAGDLVSRVKKSS